MAVSNDLPPIAYVFGLIMDLAEHDGITYFPDQMSGLWVRKIDANWTIILNGQRTPRMHGAIEVQPYHCWVEWNGWPAGIIGPFGGTLAAHPDDEGANEDHLIRALKGALA